MGILVKLYQFPFTLLFIFFNAINLLGIHKIRILEEKAI